MNTRHLFCGWMLLALPLCGALAADEAETLARSDIELDTGDHYWVAANRLEVQVVTEARDRSPEAQRHLSEALDLVWEAFRQYRFYSTADPVYLSDDWRSAMHRDASPGSPDLGRSPLSLLAHLFLAWESGEQTASRLMVQAVPYSQDQVQRQEALGEANDLARRALEAVEQGMGRKVHSSSTDRFFLEIPLAYRGLTTHHRMPVNTRKDLPDGTPERAVIVNILEAEHTIEPEEHVASRIAELKEKFPDLADVVLEEASGDGYEVRARFGYTYTWEGSRIRVLDVHHKSGQRAIEVSCLALADHFDREECDDVLRSFHRY